MEVHFVRFGDQLADIFTKGLREATLNRILQGLEMMKVDSLPKPNR